MKYFYLHILLLCMPVLLWAQSEPVILIDGTTTSFKSGLSFPYWLKAGQSVSPGSNVKSISVLEFIIDNENLKFSQVLQVTNQQTVPAGRAWKMEAVGFGGNGQSIGGFSTGANPAIFTSPKTYCVPGTYDWIVPPGVTNICIEVWGAGGGSTNSGYSPGGGAYGYECFPVVPGTHYTVVVGQAGAPYANVIQNGGSSSVGNLILANGGTGATNGMNGIGGSSNAQFNIPGSNGIGQSPGVSGNPIGTNCGFAGNGYNNGAVIIYW